MHPALLLKILATVGAVAAFNPRDYHPLKSAKCKATRRHPEPHTEVEISLEYADINPSASRAIIMVHGWPSLWSTWSNQIELLKDDYHLIALNQRGFGHSTHPGDVKGSSPHFDLVNDLVCVLEHAKVEKAICMGHDWGSQLCYEAARMRPDIFEAVVGIAVPYIPSDATFPILKNLLPNLPKLSYQVYFDEQTEKAVKELDADIRRTVRSTLRTVSSPPPDDFLVSEEDFLTSWAFYKEIPPVPFFTKEEEDYFVESYTHQGFKHTLYFYTHKNKYASWEFSHKQDNHTIPQPALAILPTQDPVANWKLVSSAMRSEKYLPNLTSKAIEGAHWVHLEHPGVVNGLIKEWLEKVEKELEGHEISRVHEEL